MYDEEGVCLEIGTAVPAGHDLQAGTLLLEFAMQPVS